MLIALRDLQHRRRRFAVSIVAVGVVFGIALLLSGLSAAFGNEARRVVRSFDAEAWVVAEGNTGPFTSTRFIPGTTGAQLAALPGVTEVSPLLVSTGVVDGDNVNLVGFDLATFAPPITDGRTPSAAFEVLADRSLGSDVGDRLELGGATWTVVGRTSGLRYFAGVPVVFARFDDVRDVQIGGLDAASSFILRGDLPADLELDGLTLVGNDEAIDDLGRPLVSAVQTIDAIRVLLWIVAAGIIGSIMYLSVLERIRDIAVLKAIGSSTRSVLTGMAMQAVLVGVAASVIALVVAVALGPSFPMAVEIPSGAVLALPLVALVIAGLASLVGIRRAVSVDPALAFGS